MSLTVEQLEFLAGKGLSAAEIVEFAKLSEKPRSANAERQARFRQRRKDAGKNECESVTESVTSNVTRDVTPPLSLPPNENISNPPTHTPPEYNTRTRKAPLAKPIGVIDQTWQDFQDLRKRKRAPLTETAMAGIEREAEKAGWPMEAALAECVTRGWQAFKADWVAGQPKPMQTLDDDPALRRLRAMKARERQNA